MTEPKHDSHSRGPSEHSVRDQIVEAATEHFGHYGYDKTTVADLAKAIGFSKAYIYKFFGSKQAIGEVICSNRLATIMTIVNAALLEAQSESDKLRRLLRALVEAGSDLFFHDRKLYEIAAASAIEQWPSARAHEANVKNMIQQIIRAGRESGEFERKTPLDEATNAIFLVMRPYLNPVQLQYNLDSPDVSVAHISALILRSLMP